MMKTRQTTRKNYVKPNVTVVICQQCLMQNFTKVNTGTGPDLTPEEGVPEDPKLAKPGNLWGFKEWGECDWE